MKKALLCVTAVAMLALTGMLGAGGAKPAYAATTVTVNTTADEAATDGQCSLREAIANANANTDTTGGDCAAGSQGADTIDLSSLSGTITLAFNLDAISDAATILGPGAGTLTIDANGTGAVFAVFAPTTISGLTMRGGAPGIFNRDALTVRNSVIRDNTGSSGGGIENEGTLTLVNDTVKNNAAQFVGGGLWNFGAGATIIDSTISGNATAQFGGGGIANGPLTIINSTISGNTSPDGGGGISLAQAGGLIAVNSTISGNSAPIGGGVCCGFAELENTIVAGQTGGGNCGLSSVFDFGYNIDDDGTCGLSTGNHSLPNTDPLLDPAGLKDNGGPTQTIALQPGSPAIDAIPVGVNGCGTTIASDQRGVSRPHGSGCDIGAFEVAPMVDLSIAKSGAPNPVVSGNRLTYTLTVTNNGPGGATGVTVTDQLPDSVHFNSMSSTQGTCTRSTTTKQSPKNGTVTCSLGALASGATSSVTIVVTTTTPGKLINTATVSGNEFDPNQGNNSAATTITVVGT
jgi:uncharacterized repeat protein (TIGR01451 family)/CSLREA domain-containing protein